MGDAGRELIPARLVAARPRRRRLRPELFPYYAFRTGEAIASTLPRGAARVLGESVATTLTVCAPRRFDGLRDNLRHARPDLDERALRRVVRGNARNLARSWVEVLRMRRHPNEVNDHLEPRNLDELWRVMDRGRGLIAVSMHFGAWEMGLAGWNARGNRLALLAELLRPPELFERVVGNRTAHGVQVIPIDVAAIRGSDAGAARRLGAAATREIYRVLRSGGAIAVAIDRDIIGNGRPMPFFGAPAPIPVGVIEIAIRTGAGILPVLLHRRGKWVDGIIYPEITYDRSAPLDAEVERVTLQVLALFERTIRAQPEQWNVLEPVWREAGAP